MPVKWSPLKVSQAVDIIEEHVNNGSTPFDLAREEAGKALLIPNLPQYMESEFRTLAANLESGVQRIRSDIARVRRDLPKDQLAQEKKQKDFGATQALIPPEE